MKLVVIILIGILAYLIFGTNKLSELGKSLGRAKRGFKESLNEIDVDESDVVDDPELVERQKKFQNKTKK